MAGLSDILNKAKQTASDYNMKYNPFAGAAAEAKGVGAKMQDINQYTGSQRPMSSEDPAMPMSGAKYAIDKVQNPRDRLQGLKGIK